MPDIVNVTVPAPMNVTIQTVSTSVLTTVEAGPSVVVVENGASPQNLFVGDDQPNLATGGIWVQTFDDGDWTLWIEDGA